MRFVTICEHGSSVIADFAPNLLRLGDGCASCTRRPFSHWLLLYAPPRRPATNQRTRNTPACFPAAICTPVRRKDSIFTNFTFSGKIWQSSSSLPLSHHGSPVCRTSVLDKFPASLACGSGSGLGSPTTSVHEREGGWASSRAGGAQRAVWPSEHSRRALSHVYIAG